MEFACTSGHDRRGRLAVNHIVDERGYGVMLSKSETEPGIIHLPVNLAMEMQGGSRVCSLSRPIR